MGRSVVQGNKPPGFAATTYDLCQRIRRHACRAALEAAAASRRLAVKWNERGRPAFRTRFGLHTGPAVIGNVGARDRINYTLVGPVANQASRLEGLNKVYGTEILASGIVAGKTQAEFVWRQIDCVIPAGTSEVLDVFELVAEAGDSRLTRFLDLWERARLTYVAGNFVDAIKNFEAAEHEHAGDEPCRVMIERCRRLQNAPTDSVWTGIWQFNSK